MKTMAIGLMDGRTMRYGGEGSDEFNAGYELRQIQEKEEANTKVNNTHLEIMAEVAWQMGDVLEGPRAESRWWVVSIAKRIIEEGIITPDSEDIDEIIAGWLEKNAEVV